MKVISWNVAGRSERSVEQAGRVLDEGPDLLALQEVRTDAIEAWRSTLDAVGLGHAEDTSARLDRRASAVLTASRWPLEMLEPLPTAQPERVLSVRVAHPGWEFELHNAHVPAGMRYGLVKVETLVAIYAALAHHSETPRILCGDFNAPMVESKDGSTRTFAERHPEHRELWEAAELAVLRGLAQFDLPDLFREHNGWEPRGYSWVHGPTGRGVRLDHILGSRELGPTACDYIHTLREEGLSDHSAVWAEFERVSAEGG